MLLQANQPGQSLAYENQPIRDWLTIINIPLTANKWTRAQPAAIVPQMTLTHLCLWTAKVSSPGFLLGILLPRPSLPCQHHYYSHPFAWLSSLYFKKVMTRGHSEGTWPDTLWRQELILSLSGGSWDQTHVTFFFLLFGSAAEDCYSFWPMTWN